MNKSITTKQERILQNPIFLVYYSFLFILMLRLTDPNGLIGEMQRLAFLGALLLPAFINKSAFSFSMICFLSVSLASFSPIIPTTSSYYLILSLLFTFILQYKYNDLDGYVKYILLVVFYFIILSLIFGDSISGYYWILTALLCVSFIKKKEDFENVSVGIMCASLGICLIYILFAKYFLIRISSEAQGGYERAQWLNPNELAGMINCGGILASAYLTGAIKYDTNSVIFRIIAVLTVLLVATVNFINASRGGTMTFFLISTMFLLYSNVKFKYKLIVGIIGFSLLIYAFQGGLMDTLIYRMGDENLGTASGRTDIWDTKIKLFFNSSFIEQVFGIGLIDTVKLGYTDGYSTHNDLVTALVAYGYIGFTLFLSLFVKLYKSVPRHNKKLIMIFLLFFLLESSSLEFFFRGYFIFIVLFIYIYKYALMNRNDECIYNNYGNIS